MKTITDITPRNTSLAPITEEHELTLEEGSAEQERLTFAQKRFRVVFYALSALTAILIVQVLWQVAVLSAKQL